MKEIDFTHDQTYHQLLKDYEKALSKEQGYYFQKKGEYKPKKTTDEIYEQFMRVLENYPPF